MEDGGGGRRGDEDKDENPNPIYFPQVESLLLVLHEGEANIAL